MTQSKEFANEDWRPVVGYEGLYDVSNFGRVRTVQAGYRKAPMTILKTPNDGRYLRCGLWKEGKCEAVLVHRAVARAFLGDSSSDAQVNHIDGDKTNNRLENLEWVTPKGNQDHAVRTGLRLSGEDHVFSKLTAEDVREIKLALAHGERGATLARKYNVTKANISSIKHGKSWRYLAA